MKFSISSYSFESMLQSGALTQLDCVTKAKEMGFDAIEFVDIIPHDGSTREEYALKLKAAVEENGLFVSNYTVAADLLFGSDGDMEKEIERICGEVELAVALGATSMRHDATRGYSLDGGAYLSFDEVLPILADGCRRITQYAEAKGIRTMVENHGWFCQDSERVERLVNAVNNKNFGLLCDMGNFMCADEASEKAVSRVIPYAFYVHAKDFLFKSGNGVNPGGGFFKTRAGNYLRGTIIGHGVVPVKQCLNIIKDYGYDGAIAIEFEGLEENLNAIKIGFENLKSYMAD